MIAFLHSKKNKNIEKEMNGLISDPESRNTHPTKKNKQAAAAVVGGAFLFLGFVLGFESSPISTSFAFNFPKPTLEKQILDFSKISWFADEIESKKISVQPQAIEDLNVNINFNAFTLPRARVIGYNKITTKIKHKTISTPWRVLAKTNISRDVKDEYIIAAAKLRTQFFSAVYIKPLSNDELFAMNLLQPSELPKSDVEVALREIVELKAKNIAPVTTSLPTPIKFHSILMAKKSKVSTPKNIRSKNNLVETSQPVIEAPLMDAEIVGVEYTKQPEESHVIDKITLEHAARLLQKAIEPFQASVLHPHRCAFHLAYGNIEGAANAHGERNLHLRLIATQEVFLLRRTDRHEQQIGTRLLDQLDNAGLFLRLPVAVAVAGHRQPGVLLRIKILHPGNDILLGA